METATVFKTAAGEGSGAENGDSGGSWNGNKRAWTAYNNNRNTSALAGTTGMRSNGKPGRVGRGGTA